jgi:O-methyltransferase involved in polyketide biosynthesis
MSMTGKVDFSGVRWGSVEWTNVCTLYLRACESRLQRPILGDRAAAEAVDRIDYDFARLHRSVKPWGNQFLVALRAKQLDVWAADFLTRAPDAVVLHLGCDLDTRVFRLRPAQGCSGSTSTFCRSLSCGASYTTRATDTG